MIHLFFVNREGWIQATGIFLDPNNIQMAFHQSVLYISSNISYMFNDTWINCAQYESIARENEFDSFYLPSSPSLFTFRPTSV
jgi:hypothetical protein